MHPLIRDLYKRFILAGRSYPQGLSHVRSKVKQEFFKNRDVNINSMDFKRCIKNGRYMVKEIIAASQMHKYRAMKKRYSTADENKERG